jgi:hypothetical protein
LVWRPGNVEKLREHGINRDDVEWLVDRDAWVSYVHPDYPVQVRVVGAAEGGRYITVVLEPMQRPGVWRPVTGWNATSPEREYYLENAV